MRAQKLLYVFARRYQMISACMTVSVRELRTAVREWACCSRLEPQTPHSFEAFCMLRNYACFHVIGWYFFKINYLKILSGIPSVSQSLDGSAVTRLTQWWSAWLNTEGPRVRASMASLHCVLEQDLVLLVQPSWEDPSLYNWKIVDGTLRIKSNTVWIHAGSKSGLIWVQTVCKGYQQTIKHAQFLSM